MEGYIMALLDMHTRNLKRLGETSLPGQMHKEFIEELKGALDYYYELEEREEECEQYTSCTSCFHTKENSKRV